MVDPELVIRKLTLITGDLGELTKIARKSLDEYLSSPIDEVRDYYDSFTQLSKLKILPPAFASRIANCAGLRNRIVHEYDDIDPAQVHEALQSAVNDIPEYLRFIHQYVQGLPR